MRVSLDEAWLDQVLASPACGPLSPAADHIDRLRDHLTRWAIGFAGRRPDVTSSSLQPPRRGLGADESGAFLRAIDRGIAVVDEAGYVTLPTVRPKTPTGQYALLSKSGKGASVNLEYLIQIGATAELILDHGWDPAAVDFERGEFDALGHHDGRVALAMEAKARVTGADSLNTLVRTWLRLLDGREQRWATNAGRKLAELARLTEAGPVLVWLVADGARWALRAHHRGRSLTLIPTATIAPNEALNPNDSGGMMLDTHPYDATRHRPGTAAHDGHCSWHGPVSCQEPPVISFQDAQGRWQSGCQRAVDELLARGEINTPG